MPDEPFEVPLQLHKDTRSGEMGDVRGLYFRRNRADCYSNWYIVNSHNSMAGMSLYTESLVGDVNE